MTTFSNAALTILIVATSSQSIIGIDLNTHFLRSRQNSDQNALPFHPPPPLQRALGPDKCVTESLFSQLSLPARCDAYDMFYAGEDCLYQYEAWHEYLCPCEEYACQKDVFEGTNAFCTKFLSDAAPSDMHSSDTASSDRRSSGTASSDMYYNDTGSSDTGYCPDTINECVSYVRKCCEFPTSCKKRDGGQELKLFAKYNWHNGDASDSSMSHITHNGALDEKAFIQDGKLAVRDDAGVTLDDMKELDGTPSMMVRFEDVTVYAPDCKSSYYIVLAGGGSHAWWVGVDTAFEETALVFNVGGEKDWSEDMPFYEKRFKIADEVIMHFDSIEYSFNGTAEPEERIAVRYNDGNWTRDGWTEEGDFRVFPHAYTVKINDGSRADGDAYEAKLGSVYFFSSRSGLDIDY